MFLLQASTRQALNMTLAFQHNSDAKIQDSRKCFRISKWHLKRTLVIEILTLKKEHLGQYLHIFLSELWGCASKSNIVIMQRFQSKTLRAIENAPWYVTNHTLHTYFNTHYVRDVIHERISKRHNKLEAYPNPLLEPLLQTVNTRRLKHCWPLD